MKQADVIVVGAGFGGLYAHWRLRQMGLTIAGFEAGPGVGGTWFWNRYPGARCDVESLDYCYSFSAELLDEWQWSERFATQPEILRYAEHVADRFDLRRDMKFNTRVISARWDDNSVCWTIATDKGDVVSAPFLITAAGCLSHPKDPDFAGLGSFTGEWVQTSLWPREGVDLAGKRVAVIGTGSSGIQAIPVIAKQAAHLTVFQRTPNFSLPSKNGPVDPAFEAKVKADHQSHCLANRQTRGGVQPRMATGKFAHEVADDEKQAIMEQAWTYGGTNLQSLYRDSFSDADANAHAANFVRAKIAEIVADPAVAAQLTPHDHPIGTKRICLDSDYYETFNRSNVALVDIRSDPIESITPRGIKTRSAEFAADVIVFATGFDAVTGPLVSMNITGSGERRLPDHWQHGPKSYLGLMVAGFPNLFTVNGPGSPSVLANMIPTVEHHIDWIADCMAHMREQGLTRIEAEVKAEDDWTAEVADVASKTLYPLANSWYNGDNVPGKPRVFLAWVGGFDTYIARCSQIEAAGYPGFYIT